MVPRFAVALSLWRAIRAAKSYRVMYAHPNDIVPLKTFYGMLCQLEILAWILIAHALIHRENFLQAEFL